MTMSEDEVRALLVVAMAYDHRDPGESDVMAWLEAATRQRWRFGPAREAIHAHYAERRDWIMPGDITQRLRAESRHPARYDRPAIEAANPAGEQRIRQAVERLAETLGWPRTQSRRDPSLSVECPYCHALAGRPCTRYATRGHRQGGHVPLRQSHPSRRDLAGAAS